MNLHIRQSSLTRSAIALLSLAVLLLLPAGAGAAVDFGTLAADTLVSTPTGLSPSTGSTLSYPTNSIDLAWNPVPGAAQYQIQIASETGPGIDCHLATSFAANQIVVDTRVTKPHYVPTLIDAQSKLIWTGSYCWRVRGVAPGSELGLWAPGNGFTRSWSGTPTGLKFYNDEDGSTPRIPTDPDYATGSTLTKVGGYLQWNDVPGAASYDIQVSNSQSFATTSLMIHLDHHKGSRIVLPHLPNDIYYWRVRSVSPNGTESAWTNAANQRFEVRWYDATWRNGANITPADGATVSDVTVGWTPMRGASYYEVQMSTRAGCVWENNSDPNTIPRPWGDWVNESAYVDNTDPNNPITYPAPPRSDACRLSPVGFTTINNYATLDKLWDPVVFQNIGTDSCWQAIVVACFDAGLPVAGMYGWDGPYLKYSSGTWSLSAIMNTIYGPGGPKLHWRVRPVYALSQKTETGWEVSTGSSSKFEVYGRWLEKDIGPSSLQNSFTLDPNLDAPISTGTRCTAFDNPTGNKCLVMDSAPGDGNRPTRMAAGATDKDDSISMQFPLLQWNQFAGNINPMFPGGYIVQIAHDPDFATITLARQIYVPSVGAYGYGWQNSVALTDSLPDNSEPDPGNPANNSGYWWRVIPCESSPALIPMQASLQCIPLYYGASAGTHYDYNDGADAQQFTKRTSITTEISTAFVGQAPLISWYAPGSVTPSQKSRGIEGADHYEVQLASDPFFTHSVRNYATTVARFVPYDPSDSPGLNNDLTDGQWYYRVRAIDENGLEGSWSDPGVFTKVIPAPVVSSPVQQTASSATISWSPVPDAEYYEVQWSSDSSFQDSTTISNASTQQVSYYIPRDAEYYWRVRAVVGENHGLWSDVDDNGPMVTPVPPLSIKFEVSRTNVPVGQSVFFDGYLSGNGWTNLNGKTLQLQRKDTACNVAGTYSTVDSQDTGETGEEGTVRIGRVADRNRCYRYAYDDGVNITYSAPMPVTTQPVMKLTAARTRVRRAANFNMTVTSNVALTGRVRVQFKVKGVWTTIKTMTWSGRSTYTFAAQINRAGSFPTRVLADNLVTSGGYKSFEDTTANGPGVRVLDLFVLYKK